MGLFRILPLRLSLGRRTAFLTIAGLLGGDHVLSQVTAIPKPIKEYIRLGTRVIAVQNYAQNVGVVVSPPASSLLAGQTQAFSAALSGTVNPAVSWSLNPSTGPGTVDGNGIYTAPFTISQPSTVKVVATSVADPLKSGYGVVTLTSSVSGLPSGWSDCGVGSDSGASSTYSNGVFKVTSTTSSAGVGGTSDNFKFMCQALNGKGTIVARISGIQNNPFVDGQFGIMMRTGPTATAAYAMAGMFGTYFGPQYLNYSSRASTGATGSLLSTPGPVAGAPYWVKLVWDGANTITGSSSPNGVDWTQLGTTTLVGTYTTLYAGLAVAGNDGHGYTVQGTFDNVLVSNQPTYYLAPPTWLQSSSPSFKIVPVAINGLSGNVAFSAPNLPQGASVVFSPAAPALGSPATATFTGMPSGTTLTSVTGTLGSTSQSVSVPATWADSSVGYTSSNTGVSFINGTFSVTGYYAANGKDAFECLCQPLTGDGTMIARLTSAPGSRGNSSAGIGVRNTLDSGAPMIEIVIIRSNVLDGAYRLTQDGAAVEIGYTFGHTLPKWFKLVRSGTTITTYSSVDGVSWTLYKALTIPSFTGAIQIGLWVTSQDTSTPITGTFDNVSLVPAH